MRLAAAAGEGQDPARRSRPHARRAPVPVHRLADGVRGDRRRRRHGAARPTPRDLERRRAPGRARRWRVAAVVGPLVPLGDGGFADDGAPRDALVAVPLPPGSTADVGRGGRVVVGGRRLAARGAGARGQGAGSAHDGRSGAAARAARRRSTVGCASRRRGSSRHTSSPTRRGARPGGEPATPLANGGAFGGKVASPVGAVARELADRTGRTVRVVYAAKTSCASARSALRSRRRRRSTARRCTCAARCVGDPAPFTAPIDWPYAIDEHGEWTSVAAPGPTTCVDAAGGRARRARRAARGRAARRRRRPRRARARRPGRRRCCSTRAWRSTSGALAGARVDVDDAGHDRARARARRGR